MDKLKLKVFADGVVNPLRCFVSFYHGQITDKLQRHVLTEIRKADLCIRVLICTIAFCFGVDIYDIRCVVQWSKSNTVLWYWQEVGRCSRDGKNGTAMWYAKSMAGKNKEFF